MREVAKFPSDKELREDCQKTMVSNLPAGMCCVILVFLLLYSLGWPQTHNPTASVSQVLGLQAGITMPDYIIMAFKVKFKKNF
jgi:hypothetical protein